MLSRNPVEVALGRRLTEQQALVELSQLALDKGEPLAVMQEAVERVAAIQKVELVAVLEQISTDDVVVRALFDRSAPTGVGRHYQLYPKAPAAYAIATGAPVLVEDVASDPRFGGNVPLFDTGIVSGMYVVIPSRGKSWGTLGVWTHKTRKFSPDEVYFLQAVANLIGGVVTRADVESRLADAVHDKDRRLRHEQAIGQCARALLGDFHVSALEVSLRALMEATDASFGYIDWQGQKLAKVPSVRLGRSGRRTKELDEYWDGIGWDELPTIRDRVRAGRTGIVKVSDLPTNEAIHFLTAPELIASEADVPILANGAWAGTLGLASSSEDREWDPEEVMTMEVAASLMGSWWERRVNAERLEEAVESRNRKLRLERAVASASQMLSQSTKTDELDRALAALLEGTDATSVFVERNVTDPKKGLCSRVIAFAQRPGATYEPGYWNMMPWSQMPITYRALSAGEAVVLNPQTLEGVEAETYAPSGVQSELDVPIIIHGEWEGLIGVSDEKAARTWDDEVQLLRTAADMIASYWARADAADRLEALMRSKDEFIASISHELRTPLTAVLGLAESMSDPKGKLDATEVREFIKIIAEQSAEMSAIVQDLLVVARSEIGSVTIRPERLDLVAEVATALRGLGPDRRTDLTISGRAGALADPIRVRQIIRNLLANAKRYGGPTIKVELGEVGEVSRVVVMDDGAGIPIEDRGRIFQPYERAHQRNGQTASVGLGLTVSRQLAGLMGGSLSYDHVDGWSTFTLELPAP
jgi:signal transduction histidine kinase